MSIQMGLPFMSDELLRFFLNKGISTSRTTAYNPACNGQVEKYNGTIWKAVTMALKTCGLPMACWQDVLPGALHSLHSLLCMATFCGPHERLLNFERRSSVGGSVPSWLIMPGPVVLKRHVRTSKDDLLVDEVELLQGNLQYTHIHYMDGWETTVSIRHLAPLPEVTHIHNDVLPTPDVQEDSCSTHGDELLNGDIGDFRAPEAPMVSNVGDEPLRCSVRHRRPPDRLNFKTWGEWCDI